MAGYWIKFETTTSDKPEVWAMAGKLQIDPDAVVGKLLKVWAWFDEQTVDGNAPSVTKALLNSKVCVTNFCEAMIEVGWMMEADGQICLPNFDRHNGKTAKNRALTSKRVADFKAGNAKVTQNFENGNGASVTNALPRREQKRRDKEVNTNPPLPPKGKTVDLFADVPNSLNTTEFTLAWAEWAQHRREVKKPLTATSIKRQLQQLEKLGPAEACQWINYTIAKGWQGLQAPDADWKRANRVHEPDPWELPAND